MHCQHAMSCTRQPPTNALMVTAGHKGFDESKEIFMGTDGGASEGKSPSVATTGTDSISYSSNASTLGEGDRALATMCGRAQLLELKQDQDLLLGAASAIATRGLVWSVTSETVPSRTRPMRGTTMAIPARDGVESVHGKLPSMCLAGRQRPFSLCLPKSCLSCVSTEETRDGSEC